MKLSTSDEDGVIGYHIATVQPAKMQPSAAAAFPSIMILPAVAFIASNTKGSCLVKFVDAYSKPACTAAQFKSAALIFLASCWRSAASTADISIFSSCAATPT